MPEFIVHMTETRHFEIPVAAANLAEARENVRVLWRNASTTGQWEISDTEEEIVSVTEITQPPTR